MPKKTAPARRTGVTRNWIAYLCEALVTSGAIPTSLMGVNGANEWGWLLYAFHPGGAHVVMADGATKLVAEGTSPVILLSSPASRPKIRVKMSIVNSGCRIAHATPRAVCL